MNTEELKAWAEQVDLSPLWQEIRKVTGLDDLNFSYKIKETRSGLSLDFTSQNLAERTGFLKLMFKDLFITQFSSGIIWKSKTVDEPYASIWGSVDFTYNHPGGGSNGISFLRYWYSDKRGWEFDDRC